MFVRENIFLFFFLNSNFFSFPTADSPTEILNIVCPRVQREVRLRFAKNICSFLPSLENTFTKIEIKKKEKKKILNTGEKCRKRQK